MDALPCKPNLLPYNKSTTQFCVTYIQYILHITCTLQKGRAQYLISLRISSPICFVMSWLVMNISSRAVTLCCPSVCQLVSLLKYTMCAEPAFKAYPGWLSVCFVIGIFCCGLVNTEASQQSSRTSCNMLSKHHFIASCSGVFT